jgi:hypothetical protein
VTLSEITKALQRDTRPAGPDGCSNVDRITFVAKVLGMRPIDLTEDYDFTGVVGEDDPILVCGAKHLALLKLDYANRLFEHGHMTKQEFDAEAAVLILAVRRMDHHLTFVERGLPTPPFPAY